MKRPCRLASLAQGMIALFSPSRFGDDRERPDADADRAEKADGWKLLFDGKSLAGWRGYKTETPRGLAEPSTATSFATAEAAI